MVQSGLQESGVATFGRGYGMYKLFVGGIMSLLFIVGGLWAIYHSYGVMSTKAVVDSAQCTTSTTRPDKSNNYTSQTINDCNLNINYDVNNKQFNQQLQSQEVHKKGDMIDVSYDPTDPSKVSQYFNFSFWGKVAIFVGIVIFLFSYGNYLLITWFPALGAAEFGIDALGTFNNMTVGNRY